MVVGQVGPDLGLENVCCMVWCLIHRLHPTLCSVSTDKGEALV